jgi:hypothetical protein
MRRSHLVAALVLVSVSVALTSTAYADWTPPSTLGTGREAQVALDTAGDATFVWSDPGAHDLSVQARQGFADGSLGPVWTLSTPGYWPGPPRVAVAPTGDAVVVWGVHRVKARAIAADGTLGPIQKISQRGEIEESQVAVDRFGNATVVWRVGDPTGQHIRSRVRFADGTLSPMHAVANTRTFGLDAHVGTDAAGDAVFAWEDRGVLARTRNADGSWSPIRPISPPGQYAYNLRFAVNSRGDAVFAWERNSDRSLIGRILKVDGTLSPTMMVSPGPISTTEQAAITDAGRAVFVWGGYADGPIETRTGAPDGSLTAVQTLSRDAGAEPDVGVDKQGNAVFTWRGSSGAPCGDPTGPCPSRTVEARTRAIDGTLGPTRVLGSAAEFPNDTLAVNPDGDAAVAWASDSGLQAAFGP